MDSIVLAPESVLAIAQQVERRQRRMQSPVLNLAESAEYVGKPLSKRGDPSAFYKWCEKYGVVKCDQGRWARRNLDQGLSKESKKRRY